MSNIRLASYAIILFFIHLLFYQYLPVSGIYPDLFLVLVVLAAIYKGPVYGSLAGFLCGISQDSFSFSYFGLYALTKTIIGYSIGKVRHSFYSNNYWVQGVIFFVLKILHDVIYYSVYYFPNPLSHWRQFAIRSPLAAIYTSVLGITLLLVLNMITFARRNR